MIFKKITIENYLCYFDVKEFELSNGLNIILGENGEGKTKFFEAIEWLFNGDNRNLGLLISAKALSQAEIEDQFRVKVAITVEQYEETKIISKSFLVKKTSVSDYDISNYTLEGIEENKVGERSQVDGKSLLDRVFPPEIRRYSMFKGESELNIFKNEDALMTLINSFSSAKHYEKYVIKGAFLKEKAERAVDETTRSNLKNEQEYKRLEAEILRLALDKDKLTVFIDTTEEQLKKTEEYIQDAERFVSNAEALELINSRIKAIEEKMNKTTAQIDENYTIALFDESWILVNFENVHREFASKVAELSSKKRELQTEFDQQKGIQEGRNQLTSELFNNSIPLPTGVPSKAHMEEMLRDEVCKVCGRPAKKGSEAYVFMVKRLEEYLLSQQPAGEKGYESKVLFMNDYTNRLFNLSVSHEDNLANLRHIRAKIRDLFKFNSKRKSDLEDLNEKLNIEQSEREKIVGSSSIGAEKLSNVLKNYNAWQKDLRTLSKDLAGYKKTQENVERELQKRKDEKDSIDIKTANTFLIKTRAILRDIDTIFKQTKEKKLDEFIELLQLKSNTILKKVNVEAFTGTIAFLKRMFGGKVSVNIDLQDDNGNIVYKPNQSLLTSMHISILFAISELAAERREENFPMIFDAPTSSFGVSKTTQFLNLIYETENQKILLIKDFLETDEKSKKLAIKKEFVEVKRNKAFWIFLERPFETTNLKTLNTQVITL